nr:hypothetical protein Iba_chr07fCG8830 [Ipomoea batatas]
MTVAQHNLFLFRNLVPSAISTISTSNLTAVGRKPPDGHFAASHHLIAGRILASPCERDKRSPQGPCSPCEANERLANWDSGKLPKMMKKGEWGVRLVSESHCLGLLLLVLLLMFDVIRD